jgi:hypothetical protein
LGLLDQKIYQNEGGAAQKVGERVLELLIKIIECFARVIICIKSKSLMYNCNSVWLGWALVAQPYFSHVRPFYEEALSDLIP